MTGGGRSLLQVKNTDCDARFLATCVQVTANADRPVYNAPVSNTATPAGSGAGSADLMAMVAIVALVAVLGFYLRFRIKAMCSKCTGSDREHEHEHEHEREPDYANDRYRAHAHRDGPTGSARRRESPSRGGLAHRVSPPRLPSVDPEVGHRHQYDNNDSRDEIHPKYYVSYQPSPRRTGGETVVPQLEAKRAPRVSLPPSPGDPTPLRQQFAVPPASRVPIPSVELTRL